MEVFLWILEQFFGRRFVRPEVEAPVLWYLVRRDGTRVGPVVANRRSA